MLTLTVIDNRTSRSYDFDMKKEIPYALRLPKETHTAMKKLAIADRRSLNALIVIACDEFIERRKEPRHA